MPGVDLFLVPYNGGIETRLSAVDAKSQHEIDDPVRETRLSELLDQRGVNVPFKFTQNGVLMQGTQMQAMVVSRLVNDLPNLTPSEKAQSNVHVLYAANEASHISTTFGDAARRFKVASMRPEFSAVAHDAPAAFVMGNRPSINGSHMRLAA